MKFPSPVNFGARKKYRTKKFVRFSPEIYWYAQDKSMEGSFNAALDDVVLLFPYAGQ